MAAKENFLNRRQQLVDSTFDYSINSTAGEEKLFGGQTTEEEDEDSRTLDDEPVVFICGKCRSPLGDSMSWDGSEDGENQIRLKRVNENVFVGKETRMHEPSKGALCLIVDLICQGCCSVLGMVYTSTPKSMDHKRFAFYLNVADIDSYVLGSAGRALPAGGVREQPVTLEYRGAVEQQLKELKMLMVSMARRLEEMEAGVQPRRDQL